MEIAEKLKVDKVCNHGSGQGQSEVGIDEISFQGLKC